jgi:hypothetical protein
MAILTPCFAAIGTVWGVLSARIAKLEAHLDDCNERWAREVRRGASLAAMPLDGPSSLPAPDWDEPTGIREQRRLLEAAGFKEGLDETLRRYAEWTPPRWKMPSRPR